MQFLNHLKKSFTFDERSLALYRFFIGFVIVADVLSRLGDVTDFYTDIGLIPRSIFVSELSMPWSLSFHLAQGSFSFAVIMFSLHFLLGVMVIFGYKTRWAIFGAYLMTVSVHNRNWLVNNGGDDILRAILFLSIFLPLNRCFSLDSALLKDKKKTDGFFSTWGLTFFFQVFAIYFVSYLLKDSPIWRSDFTAFFFSSRLDIFATPLTIWLRDFEGMGKFLTIITIILEYFGPLLLIFSFLFQRFWWVVRTFIVFIFIMFHFGIFLTMNIGLFTFICETMWIAFLPTPFWDQLQATFKARGFHKLIIYFDKDCSFCQKGVRILREFFLFQEVKIIPGQEDSSILRDMEEKHSWVVVNDKNERYFHYQAFLEILRHSPHGQWLLFFFKSRWITLLGEKIYQWVSHHRSLMGKVTQYLEYREFKKEIVTLKLVNELLGAFILITLIAWNLTTIKRFNINAPFFQNVARWPHLYQEWNMFAPFPKKDNIWVEIPAELSDGSSIELLSGSRDIYDVKDQSFYQQIPNEHWRKFYLNLSENEDYARYYAGFLCRKWNQRNIKLVEATSLKKFEIMIYSRTNLPNGERGDIMKKYSWKHWCFDEDYRKENLVSPKSQ